MMEEDRDKKIEKSLDYMKYREIISKSTATQDDVNKLAAEVNQGWWDKNKDKYINGRK